MLRLVNAHDGIPAYLVCVAGLLAIAGVGAFIAAIARRTRAAVARTARQAVDCCPHPDLDDEDERPAEVTA